MSAAPGSEPRIVDTLTLRFRGENDQGEELHELRAAHVAKVLEGVVGIHSDFAKAGAFGNTPPSEIRVRPAREGSFIIECFQLIEDYPTASTAVSGGLGSLGTAIFMSTKSLRADVSDFDHLPNGNVKVQWSDGTANEVPAEVWTELNKRKRRRKKQLRDLMAPLSDRDVTALEVSDPDPAPNSPEQAPPEVFTLDIEDYHAAVPEEEIEEKFTTFDTEAQMSAIDFDDPEKWRVKVKGQSARAAMMEDQDFLLAVDRGRPIQKRDIFNLRIREDLVVKNGSRRTKWTVLKVLGQRRSAVDDDS